LCPAVVLWRITLTRYPQPYFSRTDFVEVAFPGQPTIQAIKFTAEYTGVFPARVYSVVNERGRFLVTIVASRTPKAYTRNA
jgi:hypothetical protein